jgi:hypothetical protein
LPMFGIFLLPFDYSITVIDENDVLYFDCDLGGNRKRISNR